MNRSLMSLGGFSGGKKTPTRAIHAHNPHELPFFSLYPRLVMAKKMFKPTINHQLPCGHGAQKNRFQVARSTLKNLRGMGAMGAQEKNHFLCPEVIYIKGGERICVCNSKKVLEKIETSPWNFESAVFFVLKRWIKEVELIPRGGIWPTLWSTLEWSSQ